MTSPRSTSQSRESGQAIILIVFVFIGLLAAVGLVVDLGRTLITQTQLRRAADAAALAGSAQFRLTASTTPAQVYNNIVLAAMDTLIAHGVPTTTVTIDTCYTDATMCTTPPTKKVRVRVGTNLPLVFLSLIGWRSIDLGGEATTEAAAVDVALVIDVSDSMANDVCGGGDYVCQYDCENDPLNPCQPMQKARDAALAFLDFLSPNYDRVTVVPFGLVAGYCVNFGDTWPDCDVSAYDPVSNTDGVYLKLPTEYEGSAKIASNIADARAFVTQLKLAIPGWAGSPPSDPIPPCPGYSAVEGWDPRQCTNTNIGAGVHAASIELLKEFDNTFPVANAGQNHPSKERLRVMVLLTDGAANASGLGAEPYPDYGLPSGGSVAGYCPRSTWYTPPPAGPFCRAAFPGFTIATGRHISTSFEYDSVDYALDWSDFAMLNENYDGNGIVMFTIGLGDQVIGAPTGDPLIGEKLLRYIADGGDDGDPVTKPCNGAAVGTSCGNYYFAPTGDQLLDIFRAIAGRIFTRINN